MRARRSVFGSVPVAALIAASVASALTARPALASPSTQGVRIRLAHRSYRAGQSIAVTVVNDSQSPVLRAFCFSLQRRDAGRWVAVTRTHGIRVRCPASAGEPEASGARERDEFPLYDDLPAGKYRITVRYAPVNAMNLGTLTGPQVRSVYAGLDVLAFRPGSTPILTERQVLSLADRAARSSGDPNPSLIQHAEGTRFTAVLLSSGDQVFAWNWSYLIAVRGHFKVTVAGPPPEPTALRGTVITLVVDARTGKVTDSGISSRYPPLAKLGAVSTDLGSAARKRFQMSPSRI